MVKVLLVDTYSELYFHKACSLLEQNKIRYSIKIDDINNRYGFLGIDKATRASYSAKIKNKYRIYIPKSSYSLAINMLNSTLKKGEE